MGADWIARLNSDFGRLEIGSGKLDLLHWAYDPRLLDNHPHRHTHFEACLVGAYGKGTFSAAGKDHEISPGTFFLARPGVVHQIRNSDQELMELYWVCFGWTTEGSAPRSEADRLIQNLVASEGVIGQDVDNRILKTWEALRAVAPTALPEQAKNLVEALLLTMAQTLVPTISLPTRTDSSVQVARQAIRYIEDNLNRPLSIDEIANQVHVSPRHFTRLFTAFAAMSPARYVLLARLERARALLDRSDCPVKEIADRLGFGDAPYFTRCFTRRFGVSPSLYRRNRKLP